MSTSLDDGSSDSSNLFAGILSSGLQLATPFVQRLAKSPATPQQVQDQVLRDSALNGSGPVDHTLASQSPLGLLDFITGGRVTGQGGTDATKPQGGLGLSGNLTFIGIVAIALVAVLVLLKR